MRYGATRTASGALFVSRRQPAALQINFHLRRPALLFMSSRAQKRIVSSSSSEAADDAADDESVLFAVAAGSRQAKADGGRLKWTKSVPNRRLIQPRVWRQPPRAGSKSCSSRLAARETGAAARPDLSARLARGARIQWPARRPFANWPPLASSLSSRAPRRSLATARLIKPLCARRRAELCRKPDDDGRGGETSETIMQIGAATRAACGARLAAQRADKL